MAMATSPDIYISYPQLFSFQISYAGAFARSSSFTSPDDKKGDYRHGILEVDFHMETLFVQDRDRIFMSQSFSTLRNHVDADYLDGCSISIKFDSEQWNITSQNIAEKTCIEHLLECIVNGSSIDEALQIGKEKGIIGLDRSIQKHGQILRRAINHKKLEERFLILVPGKLFLFKNLDIIGKHARYATSLLGATLRISPEEQEFQVSAPGSKTLSLISSDPEDFDSWIEAVQASIEYSKQAARAAGMATTLLKKKRKSRASRSHRIEWDSSTLDKDPYPPESGNDIKRSVESAQPNQQPEAEAVMLMNFSKTKNQPRGLKQESRDTTDSRKQSKSAMMCLETALNEMKIAVSNIRTVRLPGPALWHKANVSPPRFYRGYEDHLHSRPDRDGRHWQPSVAHNYVDALISPRTRETLGSSQPLRRSWDSTSTVDTGAGFSRVPWRSQTMDDLKRSLPLSREDEILKWKNGCYATPQTSVPKSAMSQSRTGQQGKSAHLDLELHGITSSDDDGNSCSQSTGAGTGTDFGTSAIRAPTGNVSSNVLVPTRMPHEYSYSGNVFQAPHSDMMGQHAGLPQQQFIPFGVDSIGDPTRTKKSTVTSLDFRPSRTSKVSFYPKDDVINLPEGEPIMSVPTSSNGETRTLNSSSTQFALLTNSGRLSERDPGSLSERDPGRFSERDGRNISSAQDCSNLASRIETGMHGRTSSSDTQGVPLLHYGREKAPAQQPSIFFQAVPSEYISEGTNLLMDDSQHGTASSTRKSQATLSNGSVNLRDPYRVIQTSTMDAPNSTMQKELLGQYGDISRRPVQEVGTSNASAGEPPASWLSHRLSAEIPAVSTPTRRLSETTYSQGTIQSAEAPKQAGAPPPSRQLSQMFQYQEITQEASSSNGHPSRRNSSASSVPIAKVQLDHFTTSQFSVESNGASTLGASGYVPNTTLLRSSIVHSDLAALNSSDIGQTGPELSSRRQTHDALSQQQSYLPATPDGVKVFSQQLAYPARHLSVIETENFTERASMLVPTGSNPLEREPLTRSSYGPTHITNGGVMRDQAGAESYARPQSGHIMYTKLNESGAGVNPEISMNSADNTSSRSEETTASAQFTDVAELVNRLVRITAGDEPVREKANFPGVRNLDMGTLSADALPSSSTIQDSLSKPWERPANISRVSGDATSAYHVPAQRYSYEPSRDRTYVQPVQTPHGMPSSSDQNMNPGLQLQAFNFLGGNGTSIAGPITFKNADGEVIIIGKEKRLSTSGQVSLGAEQVQTNIGVVGQEERYQDSQEPSRRPSIGEMGASLSGDGDAWSLAILKPGNAAQIFKFETASLILLIQVTRLHTRTNFLMMTMLASSETHCSA